MNTLLKFAVGAEHFDYYNHDFYRINQGTNLQKRRVISFKIKKENLTFLQARFLILRRNCTKLLRSLRSKFSFNCFYVH
jgi:hypothetical protein